MPLHIKIYQVISVYIKSYQFISSHICSYKLKSSHATSYQFIASHISSYQDISVHITEIKSCHFISRYIKSYQFISSHISSSQVSQDCNLDFKVSLKTWRSSHTLVAGRAPLENGVAGGDSGFGFGCNQIPLAQSSMGSGITASPFECGWGLMS